MHPIYIYSIYLFIKLLFPYTLSSLYIQYMYSINKINRHTDSLIN